MIAVSASKMPPAVQPQPSTLKLSVITPVYNERHVVEASLRRVLALKHEIISELELVVVDDCSKDGSWEVLQRLAAEDPRIKLFRHEKNRGKGAALRTGIANVTGDVTIVHDADLEYNPADIPAVLAPFVKEGADAVFGSRYLSAEYRRALMYRHTQINRFLTFLSNLFTDLAITDMETCYKAVRTPLLKSIPIRSNDFRFEVEIVSKLAKRRAMIFEVPIRYLPRSYEEGKKIRAKDGILALLAMVRFAIVEDLYQDDEFGSRAVWELEYARRYHLWKGRQLRPFVGDRVLEISAGIGTLTNQLIPRVRYVATETNPHHLRYLRSYALGKPYLQAANVDPLSAKDFAELEGSFDTVILDNVLADVPDRAAVLANVHRALEANGRAIVVAPNHPGIRGTLDDAVGHRVRWKRAELEKEITDAGFEIEKVFDLSRASILTWWLNARVLKRRRFSRVQLKIFDTLFPLLRRIDRLLPWSGLSLVVIARKRPG